MTGGFPYLLLGYSGFAFPLPTGGDTIAPTLVYQLAGR